VLAKASEYRHSGFSVGLGGGGHEASNLLPAPRDGDFLSAFDALEELCEMCFCLEGAHGRHARAS
jgi:hypothetical protein